MKPGVDDILCSLIDFTLIIEMIWRGSVSAPDPKIKIFSKVQSESKRGENSQGNHHT